MSLPLISVVIPSYNREKTIERSVRSVLGQTYKNIECIVVDDCSTDNTEAVVKSINDERLKYVKLEKNSGACAARNRGIEEAKGEYIAFQDSDDEFLPEKLEKQLKVLNENNADVVFCAMTRFGYGDDGDVFPKIEEGFKSHHDVAVGFFISTQMILGKRSVFEKYRFDEKMPRMQDYDIMVRIARTEKVYFLNEPLVNVYLQDDSLTPKKNKHEKMLEVTEILIDKYPELANEYPDWNVIMLNRLALCKTMLGKNATELYKKIYQKQPNKNNKMKLMLSKAHLLKVYYRIKH